MGAGMMILVISVAFALAALRISALRSPPVVPELMMVEFIPKRNDKTWIFLLVDDNPQHASPWIVSGAKKVSF